VGLFTRERRPPWTAADLVTLGPGLTVTSALDLEGCLRALNQTLLSFRVPEFAHLPTFTSVGWIWTAEPAEAPGTVIICADQTGNDVLVALWPGPTGSRIGLFPVRGGAEQAARLHRSMLAAWRLCDTSLSVPPGGVAAGLIGLAPPVLAGGYAEEVLSAAGYRRSQRNTQIVMRAAGSLFLARAQQLIARRELRAARRFARRHALPQPVSAVALQQIIDDLARWDPGTLPHLQWIPMRARAIMLERCQDRDTFWADLDWLSACSAPVTGGHHRRRAATPRAGPRRAARDDQGHGVSGPARRLESRRVRDPNGRETPCPQELRGPTGRERSRTALARSS
jgi:hypothetical protein